MTSQSSTNKKSGISFSSRLLEDLRQKTWMLALSVLGSFLAGPLCFLFSFSDSTQLKNMTVEGDKIYNINGDFWKTLSEYYEELANGCLTFLGREYTVLMAVIAFAGAMIVAIYGFQYLYKKRMVDLYHSAPVSRRTLFTVNWLSGLLIWMVPALVCNLLTFIFSVVHLKGMFTGSLLAAIVISFLKQLLFFLIVYHSCLVAVILSGNAINALINSCIYGVLVFGLVGTVFILMYTFYGSFYMPETVLILNPLYLLSPLTTPVLLLLMWTSGYFYDASLLTMYMVGGIVVLLLNLFGAYFLYLKRPSELAERGLENKPVQNIFRICVSLISGILFCMIFREFSYGSTRIAWMVFGAIFGSLLAFCVLNIIYHCTFKELLSHKLQYGLTLACTLLLIFGTMFDLTGFNKRLPTMDSITGLNLSVSALSDYSSFYVNENGTLSYSYSLIGEGGALEFYLSKDRESIYKLLDACVNNKKSGTSLRLYVKVHTTFGSYYRKYSLSYQDVALLEPFVSTKEYAEVYYPLHSGKFGIPEHITITSAYSQEEVIEDASRMEQLMQTIRTDFSEHHSVYDLMKSHNAFSLSFFYPQKDQDQIRVYPIGFSIPAWYDHTISLIQSWYPEMAWSPTPEDIDTLHITSSVIPVYEGQTPRGALYNFYGYHEDGTPLSEPVSALQNMDNQIGEVSVQFTLDDAECLRGLEPDLLWSRYYNRLTREYVILAQARLKTNSYYYGTYVDLYIRAGKLPLSLLKTMEEHMEYTDYSHDSYLYSVPLLYD